MRYTLVMNAPHAETGTMERTLNTNSALELAHNIVAVTSENPGKEITFKVTATPEES